MFLSPLCSGSDVGHTHISSFAPGNAGRISESSELTNQVLDPAVLHALGDVAIELRGPLSVILGHSENIRQSTDENDDEGIRSIAAIEKNGRRIDRITSDILTLGALEHEIAQHGKASLTASFQFEDCVSDLRDRMGQLIRDKRPSLNVHVTPIDCRIPGDRYYWFVAFQHILENALAENPRGLHISLSAEQESGRTIIEFTDNGIGIPPNDLGLVCNPFHRIQRDRNNPRRGIGLGLHVAQRVAHYHGGDLTVSSIPGVQTTFRIEFESQ